MSNELMIQHRNHELVIGSMMIGKKMKVEHRTVKRIVKKKNVPVFDTIVIASEGNNSNPKKRKNCRPVEEFFLTETNAIIVCAHIRKNSDEVNSFIQNLSKEFVAQRRLLAQIFNKKKNAED